MKRIVILMASIALLIAPSAALADGGSTCKSYDQQLCQVANNSTTKTTGVGATTATTSAASTLPFTGLDVGLLVAGGGLLLGTGLVVRRLSRSAE